MRLSQQVIKTSVSPGIILNSGLQHTAALSTARPRLTSVLTSNFNKSNTIVMKNSVDLACKSTDGYNETADVSCRSLSSPISGSGLDSRPGPSPIFDEDKMSQPNRKRRLDFLTLEEKVKRKKLKNRVAAQTSRDRKKARMDELESEVKELQENNNRLLRANHGLQKEKEKLMAENQALLDQLSSQKTSQCQHQTLGVGCSPLIVGPAVSVVDPLPQGRGLQPAPGLDGLKALWRILTFCTLSQISLQTLEKQTTPSSNLRNLPQAYFEKLTKTNRKTLLQLMARLLADFENGSIPRKWWGRQQKTWNPVDI